MARRGSGIPAELTAAGDAMLASWRKRTGLVEAGGQQCIHRLARPRCRAAYDGHECVPPWADHPELWRPRWSNQPTVYVAHLYGPLGGAELAEIGAYCQAHGLVFSVDADSWYYPGETVRVAIRRESKVIHNGTK